MEAVCNLWAETVTLLAALGCLALTIGGWRLLSRAWPAIAFLIFMIPLPKGINSLLAQPLQSLATMGSSAMLKLTGLWVISEGNIIYVGKQPLEVAEACNGLSMMMCLSATVMAMILLVPMATWTRVVLALSVIPVALLSNILRIVATAWCYHQFGAKTGGQFAHDGAGLLMMPTALVLVGLEILVWRRLIVEEPVPEDETMILGQPLVHIRERTRREALVLAARSPVAPASPPSPSPSLPSSISGDRPQGEPLR